MDLIETAKLVKLIKRRYKTFDDSVENAKELHQVLEDLPYDVALANVQNHIRNSVYEPKPSEIRGGWTDYGERMKKNAAKVFEEREKLHAAAVPMPDEVRERLHQIWGRARE